MSFPDTKEGLRELVTELKNERSTVYSQRHEMAQALAAEQNLVTIMVRELNKLEDVIEALELDQGERQKRIAELEAKCAELEKRRRKADRMLDAERGLSQLLGKKLNKCDERVAELEAKREEL